MKKTIFILLFGLLAFFANAQKPETIDSVAVIDGQVYKLKIIAQYELMPDTIELHNRLLIIDAAIESLQDEKRSIRDKIAFFEENKPSMMNPSRAVKKPVTAKKQPANSNTKPSKPKKQ